MSNENSIGALTEELYNSKKHELYELIKIVFMDYIKTHPNDKEDVLQEAKTELWEQCVLATKNSDGYRSEIDISQINISKIIKHMMIHVYKFKTNSCANNYSISNIHEIFNDLDISNFNIKSLRVKITKTNGEIIKFERKIND